MKGYTIEKSIDLLERDVKDLKEHGGGGGGASTWNQLTNKPFNTLGDELYSLSGALTVRELSSDKVKLPDSEAYTWEDVSEAIDGLATTQATTTTDVNEINEELGHLNEDIVDLTTNVNTLSTSKQDTLTPGSGITIEDNVVSANSIYSTNEVRIGTWINGKPIYRKVYSITSNITFTPNTWVGVVYNIEEPIETLVNGYFKHEPSGTSVIDGYMGFLYNRSYNNIQALNTRSISFESVAPHYMIAEYTKTTD